MANNKHTTLMVACINPKLKQTIYIPLEDCIIGYDDKGKEIKVRDLLAFYYALNDNYLKLNEEHNSLVLKYNALLAAYKSNVAKTAMQLLDLEENK